MSSSHAEFSIAPPGRDPYRDRRPPYSEEAEQAVLGAMLMDPTAVLRAVEQVDDTMFYREGHARIVREKALLRRLIEVSTSIVTDAFEGHAGAAELLDEAEHKIFQVSQQRGTEGFTRIKELL